MSELTAVQELASRVDRLEEAFDGRLAALEQRASSFAPRLDEEMAVKPAAMTASPPPPPPPPMGAIPTSTVRFPTPSPPTARTPPDQSTASTPRMQPPATAGFDGSESFVRWAGIGLVALAGVFVVSTAVSRGWIGPTAQLALATIGGFALLAGAVRMKTRPAWSRSLGIAGAVVTSISAAAAHGWLDLVSGPVSLVFMSFSLATALAVSRLTRSESLGLVAMAAFLWVPAPFELFDTNRIDGVSVWILSALVVSLIFGVSQKLPHLRLGSALLAAATFFLVAIAANFDQPEPQSLITLACLAGGVVIMLIGPLLQRSQNPTFEAIDLRLVAGLAGYSWIMIQVLRSTGGAFDADASGMLGLAIAGGFGTLSAALWAFAPRTFTIANTLGASVVLTVSLALLLDGPVLVIAIACQAIATLAVGRLVRDFATLIAGGVLGGIALTIVAGEMLLEIWRESSTPVDAVVHLVVIGLAAVAVYLLNRSDTWPGLRRSSTIAIWVMFVVWLASVFVNFAHAPSLIAASWAIAALAGIYVGSKHSLSTLEPCGLATMSLAISLAACQMLIGLGEATSDVIASIAHLVVFALAAAATYLLRLDGGRTQLAPTALIISWGFAMLWLASVLVNFDFGQGLLSAAWAAMAIAAIVIGTAKPDRVLRTCGLATTALVLVKLLTVDLESIDVLWRALLFFVVGTGFLRLAYVLPGLGAAMPDSAESEEPDQDSNAKTNQ